MSNKNSWSNVIVIDMVELYQKAQEMGLGRDDFSAVMESVRAVATTKVAKARS